jgi:hypothetical protein
MSEIDHDAERRVYRHARDSEVLAAAWPKCETAIIAITHGHPRLTRADLDPAHTLCLYTPAGSQWARLGRRRCTP